MRVFFQQMALSSAANFCRRFGTGLRAGADLMQLLRSESQHGPARQREAMRTLADQAAQGESLSSAMETRKSFFPRLLISMTRVGEATGRLERTLLALAEHYEQQRQLRRTFLMAIGWPAFQLIAALGVLSLLIYLLGILSPATGGEMTDILGLGLRGGRGVLIFWSYILVVVALVATVYWAFTRNLGGLQNLVPLLYMIPKLGAAIQTITLARFSWTLSLALDAGLDPIRAVTLALDSTDSDYYRSATDDAEKAIRHGETLAGALRATDLFPDDFLTQIEVAELSGTDAESIDSLAREYDQRAKTAMKAMAGFASGAIWLGVIAFMIFFILRLLLNVVGMYRSALGG